MICTSIAVPFCDVRHCEVVNYSGSPFPGGGGCYYGGASKRQVSTAGVMSLDAPA